MTGKSIVLSMSFLFLMTTAVLAGAPEEITYQGRLLQNGEPVTVGTEVTFDLYDSSSGGTLRWSEYQTVTPNSEGIYTVVLGSESNPIPTDLYAALWLQVRVGSTGGVGGTLLVPRRQLTSSPYALSSPAGKLAILAIAPTNGSTSWFRFQLQDGTYPFGTASSSTDEFTFTKAGTYLAHAWGESWFTAWQPVVSGGIPLTHNYTNAEDLHATYIFTANVGTTFSWRFLTNHSNPLTGYYFRIVRLGD